MNDGAVCRTVPATQGLLKIYINIFLQFVPMLLNQKSQVPLVLVTDKGNEHMTKKKMYIQTKRLNQPMDRFSKKDYEKSPNRSTHKPL